MLFGKREDINIFHEGPQKSRDSDGKALSCYIIGGLPMLLIREFKVEIYPQGFLLSKGANLSSQCHTEKSQSTGPECVSLSSSWATP